MMLIIARPLSYGGTFFMGQAVSYAKQILEQPGPEASPEQGRNRPVESQASRLTRSLGLRPASSAWGLTGLATARIMEAVYPSDFKAVRPSHRAPRQMVRRVRAPEISDFVRRLLPALVFALGLVAHASAASVSATPSSDVDDHAHYCKCRNCSGRSCCCGPRKPETRPAPPALGDAAPSATDGPCMNSAPCGDSGLPTSTPIGPMGKAASLAMGGRVFPVMAGRHFSPSPLCILPARRDSRLDEPPERPDAA